MLDGRHCGMGLSWWEEANTDPFFFERRKIQEASEGSGLLQEIWSRVPFLTFGDRELKARAHWVKIPTLYLLAVQTNLDKSLHLSEPRSPQLPDEDNGPTSWYSW